MRETYRFENLHRHEIHKDIVDIKGIVAIHSIFVRGKSREEVFTFADADIAWMDEDALLSFVKSSPLVDPTLPVRISRKKGFCLAHFNHVGFGSSPERVDKKILQETRGRDVTRYYLCGKSGNGDQRFYKEAYWVFHEYSPCENAAELIDSDIDRFASEKAMRAFLEEYQKEDTNRPFFVYYKSYYRFGVNVLDYEKLREKDPDIIFAPALEEDEEVKSLKVSL